LAAETDNWSAALKADMMVVRMETTTAAVMVALKAALMAES
jgi:hypothetical protein